MKTVLVIAGSDSCAGAGLQADIKSISAQGVYATTAVTAITAQNTQGVQAVESVPAHMVSRQIESICSDIHIDAVKVGLLADNATIDVVVSALKRYPLRNIVVDPVMVAQSGDRLTLTPTYDRMIQQLLPKASVITPNIPEAEVLLGRAIAGLDQQSDAAIELSNMLQVAVLLKGGHSGSRYCIDVLAEQGKVLQLSHDRINTRNTHGTGCSLASAIAANLALGAALEQAVTQANAYIYEALQAAQCQQLGSGAGPIAHFYQRG